MSTGKSLDLSASDSEIANFCQQISPDMRFGGSRYGNMVLRLSDSVVVKFGLGVTEDEAANQHFAYTTLDRRIVHVPRVYRFFRHSSGAFDAGYILMEYVEGQTLTWDVLKDQPSLLGQVALAVGHLGGHKSSTVGPLAGGEPQGYIWSEDGAGRTISTVRQLEDWLNIRLATQRAQIILGSPELQFCHLDLAPRNFILKPNGSICLLDWAFAGFYPRVFEICCLNILRSTEPRFFDPLLTYLSESDQIEEAQLRLLLQVYSINQRFSFLDSSDDLFDSLA